MKILAIGAHSDDIEYGCGGAILEYMLKEFCIVEMLIMSTPGYTRVKEQDKAREKIECCKIYYYDADDTKIKFNHDTIHFIERKIKELEPNIIFIPYWDDTHQDHRNVSRACLAASRYQKNVLAYESLTSIDFMPSVFMELKGTPDKTKFDLLSCHKSQLEKTNIENKNYLELAEATAIFRGIQARCSYAEGFVPVRHLIR